MRKQGWRYIHSPVVRACCLCPTFPSNPRCNVVESRVIGASHILDSALLHQGYLTLSCISALNFRKSQMNAVSLSSKEIIKDLLLRLPDEISWHQIAQEIEFVAAVRQGMAELDRGEEVTLEQIEQELPSWVVR